MSDLNSYILQKDHIIFPGGKKLVGLNLPGTGDNAIMELGMKGPNKSRERHGANVTTAAFANQLI